jgi:hypothetical protein
MRPSSNRHPPHVHLLFAPWVLLVALLLAAASARAQLPPRDPSRPPAAAPSPPASPGPFLAGQYVDAYEQAIYDIDFRSIGGHTSKWIKAVYADGSTVYIDLNWIGNETVDGYEFVRLLDQARVGEGGRVFPGRMNRTTTPRLWAAKREAERIVGDYNLAFITQSFTGAVWTLVTATAAPGGEPPGVQSRRVSGRPPRTPEGPPRPLPEEEPIPPPTTPNRGGDVGRMDRGNHFDAASRFDYPYREVLVDRPDGSRGRLDGYDPGARLIVSRKYTQLAEVKESTAIDYLRELAQKYRPGYTISDVLSNGALRGKKLEGRQILEVPVQRQPVPRAVLEEAKKLKIEIRDVAGNVYQ